MKKLLFVFSVTLTMSGFVRGQDSAVPADPAQTQETAGTSESRSGSIPAADAASGALAVGHSGQNASAPQDYPSEGYGSRAEVFVTGFGLLSSSVTGNSIAHGATTSGGAAAGYRFHLNSWSALEGRYGFSRNSQKYTIDGAVSSIPAYLSEITGSYVFSFHKMHGIQPFLEGAVA
jgi:hypothetical protein